MFPRKPIHSELLSFEVRILHATTISSWPSTKRPRPVAGDHTTHGMKHTQHIQSKIRLGLLLDPGIQGSIKSLDFIIIIISIHLYVDIIYNIYIYYTYIWFHRRKCTFFTTRRASWGDPRSQCSSDFCWPRWSSVTWPAIGSTSKRSSGPGITTSRWKRSAAGRVLVSAVESRMFCANWMFCVNCWWWWWTKYRHATASDRYSNIWCNHKPLIETHDLLTAERLWLSAQVTAMEKWSLLGWVQYRGLIGCKFGDVMSVWDGGMMWCAMSSPNCIWWLFETSDGERLPNCFKPHQTLIWS